jgi:hypothetical protein
MRIFHLFRRGDSSLIIKSKLRWNLRKTNKWRNSKLIRVKLRINSKFDISQLRIKGIAKNC